MTDKEIAQFIGPYFKRSEIECKCGCGALPTVLLMGKLREMRNRICEPIVVTSAMRCPMYNHKIAETGPSGPHTTGLAVDIACTGAEAFELISLALEMDVQGIGVSQKGEHRFIHLDWCAYPLPRPMLWSY